MLFFSSINAQILNAGFEKWEKDTIFNAFDIPQDWYYGAYWPSLTFKDSNFVGEGNYSIRLVGGYGPADGSIPCFVQQKLFVPLGLYKITFLGRTQFRGDRISLFDFFGYGLTKDSIAQEEGYNIKLLAGEYSRDTTSQFQKISFLVPDSLWNQKVFLTFICRPTGWQGFSPFNVDKIELQIDSTVSTKVIANQPVRTYPNPTSDWLFLKNLPLKTKQLEVFSYMGKLAWKGDQEEKLNVSVFKSGNYFLVGKDELGEILFTTSFIKN